MYLSYTSKLYNTVIVKYYGNHVNLFLYFFYILFGGRIRAYFARIISGAYAKSWAGLSRRKLQLFCEEQFTDALSAEMIRSEILRLEGFPESLSIS